MATSSSAAEYVLQQIPKQHVRDVYPLVRDLMRKVCARSDGRYAEAPIARKLLAGDWQLWLVWNGSVKAIVVTELYLDVSGLKCCMIRVCTGRGAKDWTHLIADIEDWARREGCAKLDMIARKGWARELPDYRMTHVMLEKDL